MSYIRKVILLFLIFTVFNIQNGIAGAIFYVSPDGDNSWSGLLDTPNENGDDGPFATIEQARDAIRMMNRNRQMREGGVTVCIREGVYPLSKSLELSGDLDSGSEGKPVVYQAYEGETVRLVGGKQVTGFRPIFDPDILKRIESHLRTKILQTDLKAQGITVFGEMKPRGFGRPTYAAGLELFFQNKPMHLAKWPNEGWGTITGAPDGQKGGKFSYAGDRPSRWIGLDDVWVHGYWTQDWADSYEKVDSIDPKKRVITTVPPHGVYGYKKGQRFRALNLLEELDEPGEWYLDRESGMLYFWPPQPPYKGEAWVSILDQPMISLKDVSFVKIEGLTLEYTRGHAVIIEGGEQNRVAGCTLRNIGNSAVVIRGGLGNGVQSCEIDYTGDGGIEMNGGDRQTLTPARNYAVNNHIHCFGRWVRTYEPAIRMSGVGNRLAHNRIHDAPHAGVLFGGNEHLLEFNEIYNICQETGDVGGFYIGRNWTMRGNVIRHNYFHDIHGPYTHGAMAVYLDDAASGTTIFGNVFYKASRAAFIGGGRDNVVENNIFVECNPAVHIDARCLGWANKYAVKGGGWHMYDKLNDVNYDQPPYSVRYPKLAVILEDEPLIPKGNVIARNIRVGGEWLNLQGVKKEWVTFQNNFIEGDPGFVDAENNNFQLKDDSPVFELGFQRIPIEKIGLQLDEYRKELPE